MTLFSESTRPMCRECNTRVVRKGPKSVHGYQTWAKLCGSCENKKYRKSRVVNLVCSVCGFQAEDKCQIDLVEGDSLCSNCNRLRVKQNKQKKHNEYELTVDATVNLNDIRL
jgi:hypothetical protein